MTKTYAQVMKQIEALSLDVERLKREEVDSVVSRIKQAIVTVADLGLKPKRSSPVNVLTSFARLLVAGSTAVLSSCATPPGRIPDSEFMSRTILVKSPVSQALINFHEGFRQCGIEGPGIVFAVHYGEPVCTPIRSDGSAVCDIYVRLTQGRSILVHGRVDLSADGSETAAILRVHSPVNRVPVLEAWERFLRWAPGATCP